MATYKTTELRVACPASCAVYANGCDPTSSVLGGEGGGIAGLPGLEVGEDGLVQRSYVSDEYTFTLNGRQWCTGRRRIQRFRLAADA